MSSLFRLDSESHCLKLVCVGLWFTETSRHVARTHGFFLSLGSLRTLFLQDFSVLFVEVNLRNVLLDFRHDCFYLLGLLSVEDRGFD